MANQEGRFKPGQSGNIHGRPRKLLSRIDEMCHADGKHPYTELMALLPQLKPREQAEIWLQLLAYCQPKLKEQYQSEDDEEREKLKKLPMGDLLKLVKDNFPELNELLANAHQ